MFALFIDNIKLAFSYSRSANMIFLYLMLKVNVEEQIRCFISHFTASFQGKQHYLELRKTNILSQKIASSSVSVVQLLFLKKLFVEPFNPPSNISHPHDSSSGRRYIVFPITRPPDAYSVLKL